MDPAELPDPQAASRPIGVAPFVDSLELRDSAVTDCADAVFLVAAVAEKAGTFVDWEGVAMKSVWRCEFWRWVRA